MCVCVGVLRLCVWFCACSVRSFVLSEVEICVRLGDWRKIAGSLRVSRYDTSFLMPERKTKRPVGRRRVTRVSRGAVSARRTLATTCYAPARARENFTIYICRMLPQGPRSNKIVCFRRFGLQISKRRSTYSTYIKKQKLAARVLCFGPPASPSVRGTRSEHRALQSSQSISSL